MTLEVARAVREVAIFHARRGAVKVVGQVTVSNTTCIVWLDLVVSGVLC